MFNVQKEVKKDPFDMDLLNYPECNMQIKEERYVYPSADGLDDLIDATYGTFGARCHRFSREIPESAYAYYIAILCYARLLKLELLIKGCLEYDEQVFVEEECANYRVPKSVGMYFAGFGNINTQKFGEIHFKMKRINLTPGGFFGSIKDNMYAYASYPCPGVYERRMTSDLEIVDRSGRSWDLPKEYCYEGHKLTSKCLGYKQATLLTGDMRQNLSRWLSRGKANYSNISVCYGVMSGVSAYLSRVPGIQLENVSDKSDGCLSQMITVKRVKGRSCQYIYSTPLIIDDSIRDKGVAFRYSVDKGREQFDDINNYKELLPVEFKKDQEVPANVNINVLYESSNRSSTKMEGYAKNHVILIDKICNIDIKTNAYKSY